MLSCRKLNLGCGTDVRQGYVNIDVAPLPGVDLVRDLNDLPLPFPAGSVDEVLCKDVLEHLEYIPLLRELQRMLAPGGRLVIESPHFTSRNAHMDPTHKHAFSIDTFQFFVRSSHYRLGEYYFDFAYSEQEEATIVFHQHPSMPWNRVLAPLVNLRPVVQRYYEATGLSRLFPALNVRVVLRA